MNSIVYGFALVAVIEDISKAQLLQFHCSTDRSQECAVVQKSHFWQLCTTGPYGGRSVSQPVLRQVHRLFDSELPTECRP